MLKHLVLVSALAACNVPVETSQLEQATCTGSAELQELRFSPIAPNPFEGPSRTSTGTIHNYSDPNLATHSVLTWEGADNNGTTLTGIDATGTQEGDVRIWTNPSDSGIDVGTVMLKHEDEGSLAENRFSLPCATDYPASIFGLTPLMRVRNHLGELRWAVLGGTCRHKRALIQSLQIYPGIQIGTAASPISGTLNNWNPIGETTFGGQGIDTSDLKAGSHTLWRVFTADTGATITGLGVGTALNGSVDDFGPVKIIKNYGPGKLTLAHRGSSDSPNQIIAPSDEDVVLLKGETAWLIKPYYGGPDATVTVQWHVIGLARGDVRDNFRVDNKLEVKHLEVDTVRHRKSVTPAVMPATTIYGYDPADAVTNTSFRNAYRLRLQGSVGTVLCSMKPGVEGEEHVVTNYSSAFIVRSLCAGADPAEQFVSDEADKIIGFRQTFRIVYEGNWLVY